MKHYSTQYLALLFIITVHTMLCTPKTAVINVPIADLFGEAIETRQYSGVLSTIPVCASVQNGLCICPRIHQALFNELVTIREETNTEYCVDILNAYYVTEKSITPHTRYWVAKHQCRLLDPTTLNQQKIPVPLSFQHKTSISNAPVITLRKPWCDTASHTTFSVGTRFIYLPEKTTDHQYTITFFDTTTNQQVERFVDKKLCYAASHSLHVPDDKRTSMLDIIRDWIRATKKGSIPYVWGGCSYTCSYKGHYAEIHRKKGHTPYSFYAYPRRHKKNEIQTGFDCAGVILRAAQIVGIPFFCKNSYTMYKKLKHIQEYGQLKPGDILWIPGHVMLIADLERNTIIEARGYTHGYGKLQEIPLSEEFKDLHTFKELMERYQNKLPLYRLDKKGTVVNTIPSYAILKLF